MSDEKQTDSPQDAYTTDTNYWKTSEKELANVSVLDQSHIFEKNPKMFSLIYLFKFFEDCIRNKNSILFW